MVKARKPPARMNQARREGASFMPGPSLAERPCAAPDKAPGLMLRVPQHGADARWVQCRPLAARAVRFMLHRKANSEET